MQLVSRLLFVLIILLAATQGLLAQDENYVLAFGKLKVEWGNNDNTNIILIEDGREIDTYKPEKNGKFQFSLELNHMYMFWFQKPGYVTKKVQFSTRVPESVTSDPDFIPFPDFDFYVTLFESYPDVDTMFFTKPVGKIQYNKAINDFDWDKDYTLEIQRSMEQIEKDIRDKHEQKIKDDEEKEEQNALAAIKAEEAKKEEKRLADLEQERKEKEEKEAKRQAVIEKERQEKENKAKELAAARQADDDEKAKKEADRQAKITEENLKKEKQKEAETLAKKQAQQEEADKLKQQNATEPEKEPEPQGIKEEQISETPAPNVEIKDSPDLNTPKEVEKANTIPERKEIEKETFGAEPVQTRSTRPVTSPQKPIVSKQEKVEVAGKTVTQTVITHNGSTLTYIKVVYTWGGKFFFIQDEDKAYRNISENYYNIMISKK